MIKKNLKNTYWMILAFTFSAHAMKNAGEIKACSSSVAQSFSESKSQTQTSCLKKKNSAVQSGKKSVFFREQAEVFVYLLPEKDRVGQHSWDFVEDPVTEKAPDRSSFFKTSAHVPFEKTSVGLQIQVPDNGIFLAKTSDEKILSAMLLEQNQAPSQIESEKKPLQSIQQDQSQYLKVASKMRFSMVAQREFNQLHPSEEDYSLWNFLNLDVLKRFRWFVKLEQGVHAVRKECRKFLQRFFSEQTVAKIEEEIPCFLVTSFFTGVGLMMRS